MSIYEYDKEKHMQFVRQEGYEDGYNKGSSEGYISGHNEGYNKGHNDGRGEGYQELEQRLKLLGEAF